MVWPAGASGSGRALGIPLEVFAQGLVSDGVARMAMIRHGKLSPYTDSFRNG